ncbi:diacylglycerol/lipid kinase family protein [Alkalibaculum sporogenes]|nr:YegS/Rv2252/BmrU family lipid kinase [Alkalibaculum sporogenes]
MDTKYIFLIYNPVSGNKSFCENLDYFFETFQNKGYEIHIYRTSCEEDFSKALQSRDMKIYDALIVAGGDGSINFVLNCLIELNIDIPLGVIPAGTMNDICYNMGMSLDIVEAIDSLSLMHMEKVDIGLTNDKYFLNTCGAGLFMEVSQNTDRQLKNVMGRAAYLLTGIKELPKFKKWRIRITTDEKVIEDEFYFFIVMNGKGAGGFHKLAPEASMNDGLFDLIAVKACPLNELPIIFAKVLTGTHTTNKNVLHLKSENISIENMEDTFDLLTDMDGEEGPQMPLKMSVIPSRIKMILPPKQ